MENSDNKVRKIAGCISLFSTLSCIFIYMVVYPKIIYYIEKQKVISLIAQIALMAKWLLPGMVLILLTILICDFLKYKILDKYYYFIYIVIMSFYIIVGSIIVTGLTTPLLWGLGLYVDPVQCK